MTSEESYQNHIQHYQLDGEYYDFFTPGKFMEQEIRRRYQQVFRLFQVQPENRILEIGSGGGFALENLTMFKPTFVPADIPSINLRRMKKKASFPIFPASADVYNLPFQENTFDLGILLEVVEHLSEPERALKEVSRTLTEKGKVAVSVPYREQISYQICIHCNKPTPTHSHLHSFDQDSLKNLLEVSGFEIFKILKICNKILNRLHFNVMTRNLPFPIWRAFDGFANSLIDKPVSLIAYGRKK